MENIRDIKKHLTEEHYSRLSIQTGYSCDYIKCCVKFRRNNRLIVLAARQMMLSA